jgi:hypothetical protein
MKKPLSKVEKICCTGKGFLIGSVAGIAYFINGLVQQGKHLYYHVENKPHKKIERGEWDSDAFFDHFPMYVTD